MKEIFGNINFIRAQETNLAGNQWIGDVNRLKFTTDDSDTRSVPIKPTADEDEDFDVTLNPMQIRTFILNSWTDTKANQIVNNDSGSASVHNILVINVLTLIVALFVRNMCY